jgi:glutamate racemase
MDTRPIGVFDSGLGGLTTVRELRRTMPNEDIVYFGDTGRVPYGSRSPETILRYARQDIRFLLSKDVKMIIVACNTATAMLAGGLQDLPAPCVEVLTPAVEAACARTRNGRIGIIGTKATIRSGAYERALHAIRPELTLYPAACPLFVPLVENGFTEADDPIPRLAAERYLSPLRQAGVDTLILGCTHYPILRPLLRNFMGESVEMIDSGAEAAHAAKKLLESTGLQSLTRKIGCCDYYVSDSAAEFAQNAGPILGESVCGQAEQIDIESY